MTVKEYLNQKYKKTKWSFIDLLEVLNEFGEDGREQLNQLVRDGYIQKRKGANNPVIEILKSLDD